MNVTYAWEPPISKLWLGLLTPFTAFYRPAGAAVYRLLFDIVGLHALTFRVFVYGLLMLNLFLIYRLGSRLSGSREIGALSALLYTYHGRMDSIYLNNGTLYDVLCATLTFTALLFYVRVRQRGLMLRAGELCAFILLFGLALNAKEMAAAVPILLFCYEICYHPPSLAWRESLAGKKLLRQMLPAVICGAIVFGAALAKGGKDSVMAGSGAYQIAISLHQFFGHWRRLMTDLFYVTGEGIKVSQTLQIWAALLLLATVSRRAYLWYFLAFALLAPVPIILFPFRGFYVMYLPLAGWAMLAATILVKGRNWLWSRVWKRPPLSDNPFEPERVFLFAATGFIAAWLPLHDAQSPRSVNDPGQIVISGMKNDILSANEPLPPGARLLFLRDRFPPEAYGTVMIVRLLYRDRSIQADRPTMMTHAPDESTYDRVFDYVDGKLVVVRRRNNNVEPSNRPLK